MKRPPLIRATYGLDRSTGSARPSVKFSCQVQVLNQNVEAVALKSFGRGSSTNPIGSDRLVLLKSCFKGAGTTYESSRSNFPSSMTSRQETLILNHVKTPNDVDDRVSTSMVDDQQSPLLSPPRKHIDVPTPSPPKLFRVLRRPSVVQQASLLAHSALITREEHPVSEEPKKPVKVLVTMPEGKESVLLQETLPTIPVSKRDIAGVGSTVRIPVEPVRSASSAVNLKLTRPPKETISPEASTRLPKTNLQISWDNNPVSWANIYENFKFAKQLGQGTFARVYEVTERKTGKPFAIKVLDKDRITELHSKHLIEKELQVLSALDHPNICKFKGLVEDRKRVYFVLEHCGISTLGHYVRKNEARKLTELQAKQVFMPIVKAIAYLHEKGFSHRDVKLTNILIGEGGENVKLIDFGFADFSNVVHTSYCGTPAYMAPEIVEKRTHYGPPCDVWALGVILFKLIVGEYPFGGRFTSNHR